RILQVVARASGHDHGHVGLDLAHDTVNPDFAMSFLHAKELISIVMHFFPDLLAGLKRHQDELHVSARVENAAKIGVRLRQFFDIFNKSAHDNSLALAVWFRICVYALIDQYGRLGSKTRERSLKQGELLS